MDSIQKKEAATSIFKTALNSIPYVGNLLNEVIFEFRGRVKQERLNKFTKLLAEYFEKHRLPSTEVLETEEFGDLFESILKRVMLTKSTDKHLRFRDIIINYINQPIEKIEDAEVYLDLINTLDEVAILILANHRYFNKDFYRRQLEISELMERNISLRGELQSELDTAKREIEEFKKRSQNLMKYRNADFYGINEGSFLYYKQILFAKGLLQDEGIGAINTPAFLVMGITEFGQKFIDFILSEQNNR